MTAVASPSRRLQGDDGAILIEFALVAPILLLFVFGLVDFGLVFRDRTTMTGSTRSAARVAAQVGNERLADQRTLTSLFASVARLNNGTPTKVIIYRATAADGAVPPNCLAVAPSAAGAGVSGVCNVYSGTQLANAQTATFTGTTSCTGGSLDRFWCPTTRRNTLTGPPDFVGVYIEVEFESVTGVLPNVFDVTDRAVARIEPKV